jgi:hypothetical protein
MKTNIKNAIVGSLALTTVIMAIKWLAEWFFKDREPSLQYVTEFLLCAVVLVITDCIYHYFKSRKK